MEAKEIQGLSEEEKDLIVVARTGHYPKEVFMMKDEIRGLKDRVEDSATEIKRLLDIIEQKDKEIEKRDIQQKNLEKQFQQAQMKANPNADADLKRELEKEREQRAHLERKIDIMMAAARQQLA